MRFLASVLLLTMFSGSAIAKEQDRWLYLDCLDVLAGGSNTFAIDMTGKQKVETSVRYLKIKKISKELVKNINETDFIYTAVGKTLILFQGTIKNFVTDTGKKYDHYKMYFEINRINGKMTVYHGDEREMFLMDVRYSSGDCKRGRRF